MHNMHSMTCTFMRNAKRKMPYEARLHVSSEGGIAISQVRPAFMSSETYNKLHLQYRRVGVARFPNVAFLTCCSASYAAGSTAVVSGSHLG